MKKALLILHQKRSVAGDIEIKLKKRGYYLEFCRPPLGDNLPSSLNNYSLIVIFGGPMSANDQDDYIKKEINFMKLIIESKVPYLGICLGAQFLAKYLGSKISKNTNNLSEIGFFQITPTKEGEQLFINQNFFYQFHSEGFEIPSQCISLAHGNRFKNQAFKYKNCYALQFHPEVNFKMHLRWLLLVLLKKPKVLFQNGAQNIIYQLILRFKFNRSISLWLDNFLDNYLLKIK
jgi:GMP synthase (glutamine-hydrolysing)